MDIQEHIKKLEKKYDDLGDRVSSLEFRLACKGAVNPQKVFDAAVVATRHYYPSIPKDLFTCNMGKYANLTPVERRMYNKARGLGMLAMCHEMYGLGMTTTEVNLCCGYHSWPILSAYKQAILTDPAMEQRMRSIVSTAIQNLNGNTRPWPSTKTNG